MSSTKRLIPGTPGQVTGGSSAVLGRKLNEAMDRNKTADRRGYQAHHILPSEHKNHDVFKKIGMDFDHASNGIFLPSSKQRPVGDISGMPRHAGSHDDYNKIIKQCLDKMDQNAPIELLHNQVYNLQTKLRSLIESGIPIRPKDGVKIELIARWIAM